MGAIFLNKGIKNAKMVKLEKNWAEVKKTLKNRGIFHTFCQGHLLRKMISHKSTVSKYMRLYYTVPFVRDYFIERQYLHSKDELMWLCAFINEVVKEQMIQKTGIL